MMHQRKLEPSYLSKATQDALAQADLANEELSCIGHMVVQQLTCCADLIGRFRFDTESDTCVVSIPQCFSRICASYARVSFLNHAMQEKVCSIRAVLEMLKRDIGSVVTITGPTVSLADKVDIALADLEAAESIITTVEERIQGDIEDLIRIGNLVSCAPSADAQAIELISRAKNSSRAGISGTST